MSRFAFVLAIALAACTQETEAPAPIPEPAPVEQTAIDPNALTGEGWGALRIGMTRAEMVTAVGEDRNPNAVGGAEPDLCDQLRPARAPDDMIVMLRNNVVSRISLVGASDINTDRGFGPGDSAATVKGAYGDQAIVSPHKYLEAPAEYITIWTHGGGADYVSDPAARGIRYEIDSDGNVQAVHAGDEAIQYVEGCS